jgi:type I restriction enzyme S subunit
MLKKSQIEAYDVRYGDIVFNRTSETQEDVGLAAVYCGRERVVFGGFVIRGRPKRDDLDVNYSGYALRSPMIRSQLTAMGQGAIRANIGQADLRKVLVPLPLLTEQRAIAAALGAVDALLGTLHQFIAKKYNLRSAMVEQFVTGRRRLPGFVDDWKISTVEEVADVKTGPFGSSLHENDYVETGTPIITVEHLGEFGVVQTNMPMVSEADRRRLSAYALKENDIVFSRVGSIDRRALIGLAEAGWLFSGRLLRVRPNASKAFAPYLSYVFRTERFLRRIRSVAVGQTMPSLNTRLFGSIPLLLPHLTEQRAIAIVLSDMDAEIVRLEAELAKTHLLKQGMMHELLTGRKRLV